MSYTTISLIILLACSSSTHTIPYAIRVLKGPSDQLIFFVYEKYRGINAYQYIDSLMVERFITIMKLAETMPPPLDNVVPHGSQGFHVLVESSPSSLTSKNLLNSLIPHASQFKKHIFEDIATQRFISKAHHLLQEPIPPSKSESYLERPSSSIERDAHNNFHSSSTHEKALHKTTLGDVFTEFKDQLEAITVKKLAYPEETQKNIDYHLKMIRKDVEELRKVCTCFNITEQESILEALLTFLKNNTKESETIIKKVRSTLALPSNRICHLSACLRVLDISTQNLDMPIIVIADGQDASSITSLLTSYSFSHVAQLSRKDTKNNLRPLTVNDLDNLALPLKYFEELPKKEMQLVGY